MNSAQFSAALQALTAKQLSWFKLYISNGYNATRAYIDSEYSSGRTNHATIRYNASELRRHPKISPLIAYVMRERGLSRDELMARVGELTQTDPGDLAEVIEQAKRDRREAARALDLSPEDMGPVPVELVLRRARERGLSHRIREIGYDGQGRLQIKLHDSLKAAQIALNAQTEQEHVEVARDVQAILAMSDEERFVFLSRHRGKDADDDDAEGSQQPGLGGKAVDRVVD